jgi:CBS domain-containing protein
MLRPFDLATRSLLILGGLNWLAAGAGKFDLVAAATGSRFGRPNIAARTLHGIVGGAALYSLARLIQQEFFGKPTSAQSKRIREAMTADPESIAPRAPVSEAAQLMRSANVGSLPVVEGGRLVGVVTDRDIAVRVVADGHDPNAITVGQVTSAEPVTVEPEHLLEDALRLMARHQVRRLPVVEEGQLVGIVAQADVALEVEDARTGETVERISE